MNSGIDKKNIKKGLLPYLFLIIIMLGVYYAFNVLNNDVKVLTYDEFNEKLEIINGRYFFLTPDITLTDNEYNELCNANYDDENVTYYVSRDNEGNLIVY